MTTKKLDFRGQAFKDVLGFTIRHWREQPWRIFAVTSLVLLSALADVLTPLFAGHLVDAIASGSAGNPAAWHAAVMAFGILAGLGLGATLLRQGVFMNMPTASPAQPCARSRAACGRSTSSTTRC
jgi:ATP-binding cassette subfamily B protein